MKNFLLYFISIFLPTIIVAQTIIPAGTVSGTWTLAGSPYIISGDINCTYLTIQPGVDVRFQESGLTVYGALTAIGTALQPIVFESNDTTGWTNLSVQAGGSKGIFIYGNTIDTTKMDHCVIKDCKGSNWNCVCLKVWTRHFILSNSEVYHNNIYWESYIISSASNSPQFLNNRIHDNSCRYVAGIFIQNTDAIVSGNELYNNSGAQGVIYCSGTFNQVGATIVNNNIHHNRGSLYASGIEVEGCKQVLIKNNTIAFNHSYRGGTGIDILDSHPKIISNLICNNSDTIAMACGITDGGCGILVNNGAHNDTAEIYNNIIANNTEYYSGGGIRITGLGGTAFIENNTIANNKCIAYWTSSTSGIDIAPYAHVRIRNNIISGNRTFTIAGNPSDSIQISTVLNDTLILEYNFIETSGVVNILIDPTSQVGGNQLSNILVSNLSAGLVAPTTGAGDAFDATVADWHLIATSVCINMGTINLLEAMPQPFDFYSAQRIVGNTIDIGAAESQIVNGIESTEKNSICTFPNPVTDFLYLNNTDSETEVSITDLLGNLIMNSKLENGFNVSELSSGIYLLSYIQAGIVYSTKFVKQ